MCRGGAASQRSSSRHICSITLCFALTRLRSSGRGSILADAEVNRHGANSRRPEHVLPNVLPSDDAKRAESRSRSLDTHGSLEVCIAHSCYNSDVM